ncbi:putative flavin-binding monooxygenase [Tothia fuscella]|uniref:Flavin-binding monooxygenase n=1 Tax=Tothia fuscella TaxID=1048955 RepID=A0A9P4U280_9PEZI|nr:putative flavin-binding monooxygenase [Tothia fuscella]
MSTSLAWESNHGKDPDVLIIGAGISGICTAINLLRHTPIRNFLLLEKGSQIGGTWNDNQYPGCCCDVWSHLYSLSFEPNPSWSREYPGQEEIHAYLKRVCQKWGLYSFIQFNSVVEDARWDGETLKWCSKVRVTGGKSEEFAKEGYVIKSDYLVSAVGQLNMPYYPDIPGLGEFKGTVMHSARWDWSKRIEGLNVGIIGNGATAAQIVPEVAKTAKTLTVFQRTPNWLVPRDDKKISGMRQALYRYLPPIRRRYRASLMDFRESWYDAAVVEDSDLNNTMRDLCAELMTKQLVDKPELVAKLTPNYPPGCKRIIISDDYYPALNRQNVELNTGTIEKTTETGIVVEGKEIKLDVLILATGFKTVQFMYPIKIYGENGRSLEDIWPSGARAYLGITVESLPNFSMLYGPNTNLGHNSIILMIEAQSRYITEMISQVHHARSNGHTLSITPSNCTVETFNEEIQERLQKSTFASDNCNSWYKNEDGVITNNWCGNVIEYQNRVSAINWKEYEITGSCAETLLKKDKSRLGRVVEESNSALIPIAGVVSMAALGVAAYLVRYGPRRIR